MKLLDVNVWLAAANRKSSLDGVEHCLSVCQFLPRALRSKQLGRDQVHR
jgi:hypothetical protein